jgi:hypothetical protein
MNEKKKVRKKKHKNHEQQTKIQEIYERKQTNKIEKKKSKIKKKKLGQMVDVVVLFGNLKNKQAKHVYKTFYALFFL